MLGLHKEEIDAYDSKGEPVAALSEALITLNAKGWELIHQYFPALGTASTGQEKKAHPEDPEDLRFVGYSASEDPAASPMPLLSMVRSLPESELSGGLRGLHGELAQAMGLPDYSTWNLDELRKATNQLTGSAKTRKGVKYRAPKQGLSFKQALQLYAMTVVLVRTETKWTGKTGSPAPDMVDFTLRLSHQLPVQIPDGGSTALLLYLPGVVGHPLNKDEFEERTDVVVMARKGAMFEVEQFPVYLTTDQKQWNPTWIEPNDELNDVTLIARKFEHDWTRLDGPFLWFRPDQHNGAVVYRATVQFASGGVLIEAKRDIERRGAVKMAERPSDYDPQKMTAFAPTVDAPVTASNASR